MAGIAEQIIQGILMQLPSALIVGAAGVVLGRTRKVRQGNRAEQDDPNGTD